MLSSLLIGDYKECGNIKRQLQQNIVKLYEHFWGKCLHALQSESMSNIKNEDFYETYHTVWLINKLKLLCGGVDSHINKLYSTFITLKDFYMIRQQSGEMVMNYFDCF